MIKTKTIIKGLVLISIVLSVCLIVEIVRFISIVAEIVYIGT